MPCMCYDMEPNEKEVYLSRVMCLLEEIEDGKSWKPSSWSGNHPKVYNKLHTIDADELVSRLCSLCQEIDVTEYSLELQMWWRDHQEEDKRRIEEEIRQKNEKEDRERLLSKLSDYEKKLLGVDSRSQW